MIGFRDKTFCGFWEECKRGQNCHRALTPQVEEAAERWWGGEDAPILQFYDKPHCFEELPEMEVPEVEVLEVEQDGR